MKRGDSLGPAESDPLRVKIGGEDLRGPMSGLRLITDVHECLSVFGCGPIGDIVCRLGGQRQRLQFLSSCAKVPRSTPNTRGRDRSVALALAWPCRRIRSDHCPRRGSRLLRWHREQSNSAVAASCLRPKRCRQDRWRYPSAAAFHRPHSPRPVRLGLPFSSLASRSRYAPRKGA